MNTRTLLRAVGLMVLLSSVALAQESQPTPSQFGAYDIFGTLKAGYRYVSTGSGDLTGDYFKLNSENLFREQYNLTDSGFALGRQLPLSFSIFGSKREGEQGFFDQLFLNADFNPTVAGGSLRLRQFGAYDFDISYKHVDYFYDRYDSLFQDLRRHESNRNDLSASLDVTATENFGVNVGYHMTGHGGTLQLPRPMFVEGAPEGTGRIFFNVFRNYYLMEAPREDLNSEFFGSLNASFDFLDVSVGAGYTSYTEDYSVAPIPTRDSLAMNFRDTNNRTGGMANQFGLVGDGTQRERLHSYLHTEDRKMSGPYVFGQAVITPVDMFSLTADVRFDMLDGETSVLTHQLADVRKTSAARAFQLYRGHYAGTIHNELDQMRASIAATVTPIPMLSVTAGLKLTNHQLASEAEYHLAFDTTTSISEVSNFRSVLGSGADSIKHMEWSQTNDQPTQTYFGSVNFAPTNELTISAGVRYTARKPDVTRAEHGELDSVVTTNMSKEVKGTGFDFGASYRPIRELRLRGRFEMSQREATFGEDQFAGGPTAGTVTDLEPRTAPEDITKFSASCDWNIIEGLDAGLSFSMKKGRADLNESMWVLDGPNEKVELVDDATVFSGRVSYRLDDNTSIRLMGESRQSEFSIPMTWTRGQEVINPLFPTDPTAPPVASGYSDLDSGTVMWNQTTDDIYLDFGFDTKFIDALSLGASISFLKVTGEPTTTSEVKVTTGTPTKQGDVTRVGGPFDRMVINGNLGYDITKQFGIMVDMMYALQNEDEILDEGPLATRRFYGINDYNGLSAAFSVVYNF